MSPIEKIKLLPDDDFFDERVVSTREAKVLSLMPEILAVVEAAQTLEGNHGNTTPGYVEIPADCLGTILGALVDLELGAKEVLR